MTEMDTNKVDEKIEEQNADKPAKENRFLPYIIIGVCAVAALVAGFFVGKKITKDKEIAAAKEYIEWESKNHTWMEATVDAPKTCKVCGATEGEPLKRVHISDWSYDHIDYISKDYLMVQENNKFFLIDRNGNKIGADSFGEYDIEKDTWCELIEGILYDEDAIKNYSESHNQALKDGIANGWDYYRLNLQDGSFIVMTSADDEYPDSFIYDRDLNLIKADSLYTMTDYRDGCIVLVAGDDNPIIYNTERGLDSAFMSALPTAFGSSYGMMTGLFDFDGERYNIYNVAEDKFDCEKYDDYLIYFYSSPNKEGWTLAYFGEVDNGGKYCFYNVNTKEMIEWPETGKMGFRAYKEKNGAQCAVLDGRIAIYNSEAETYRIYDIQKNDYLTGEYKYCDLAYYDYLLCNNLDDKWGYLKNSDLSEVGEWHDDATNFCNGYALVTDGGKARFIDENMQVVSEEFDAESGAAIVDSYLDCIDIGGSTIFAANIDGKYHLVTLE